MAEVPPWSPWKWAGAWTAVFVLNLPIPVLLTEWVLKEGEVPGMVAGVGVLWLAGLAARAYSERLGQTFIRGSLFVIFIQVTVIPYVVTGLVAEVTWQEVIRPAFGSWPPGKGFSLTVMTALPFLLLAWILGGGPKQLFGRQAELTAEQEDYV